MSSSDDFFNNELSSPPKQAASLNRTAKSRKAPPPPPPRRTGTASTGSKPLPSSTAAGARPRPAARPTGTVKPAGTSTAPTIRPGKTGTSTAVTSSSTAPSLSSSTTAARPIPVARASRKAPAVSRPVGQYYASTAAGNTSSAYSASTTSASTSGSFYGSQNSTQNTAAAAVPATANTSASDTWDWGSPSPAAAAAATPASTNASNPSTNVNSWMAPAPAAAASNGNASGTTAGGSDWFSGSNNTNTATASQSGNGAGNFSGSSFFNNASSNNGQQSNMSQPFLSGSMDDAAGQPANTMNATNASNSSMTMMQPRQFMPQASTGSLTSVPGVGNSSTTMNADEAPLLEELGINLEHIGMKTKAVILPSARLGGLSMEPADIVQDSDLAGPIAFALILGAEMVLAGKLQFGYIYGFGVFGCLSMTLIVNLMSPLADGISVWTVSSVLGYALIPVNVLAAVKLIVINLVNLQTLGRVLGLMTVAWSTVASTRLLELGCGLREQRYLIAYPIALLYSAFVMITIF